MDKNIATDDLQLILDKIGPFFIVYKVRQVNSSWIITGALLSEATEQDLTESMKGSDYTIAIRKTQKSLDLFFEKLSDPIRIRLPKISRLHLVLFLATIVTTIFAGSLMAGGSPITSLSDWEKGIPFSFVLMMILGCHESGHYFYARKHKVEASLPYFIPAPTFVGTFGAFIKIKSPIQKRLALLEIGASGPIAGFLVAIPALIWGLAHSTIINMGQDEVGLKLGDSILMKILTWVMFPGLGTGQDILLHPIAFAGWIGLLVTMLNLLPIGQLDGGHIAYAMLGKKFDRIAQISWLALIPMSLFSLNWLVWGLLILFLMKTTKHPPIEHIDAPITTREKWIGAASLAIFILCFIPSPFPS
tara:strand:+ start:752 stop:1831 length:1080 start_codon:yes stop_codon:yes gene_type:complete